MSNNTKFKVGQVWRARDGSRHTIAAISSQNVAFPVSSVNYTWTLEGKAWVTDRHPNDLVELIVDAQEPVAEKPKPQFRVGQVWRARDGSSHTISAISTCLHATFPVHSIDLCWTMSGSAFEFESDNENPGDLVELIEDAPEQTPVYRDPSTLERLERFALAETLSDYDDVNQIDPYHAVLKRLNGEPPAGDQAGFAEWEAIGRAKLKVLRAKALLAVLEAEGGEA